MIAIGQTLGILILMSLGTVMMKLALGDVSPWTFAAVTVLIGMITLTLYTFVIRRERIPSGMSREVWFYIIMIGLCNFAIARLGGGLDRGFVELLPDSIKEFGMLLEHLLDDVHIPMCVADKLGDQFLVRLNRTHSLHLFTQLVRIACASVPPATSIPVRADSAVTV